MNLRSTELLVVLDGAALGTEVVERWMGRSVAVTVVVVVVVYELVAVYVTTVGATVMLIVILFSM
jgi:hypothetical protein